VNSYVAGDFAQAVLDFRACATNYPSANVFHNLGNSEWRSGNAGRAVWAWERALWTSPYLTEAAANLRFARKSLQIDAPELTWLELCSTWLPHDTWLLILLISFWSAVSFLCLPYFLHVRRQLWQQAAAAICFGVFLLCVPAIVGLHTRYSVGAVVTDQVFLRLTPTKNAQPICRIAPGEMGRMKFARGEYVYVLFSRDISGWLRREEFLPISQ
jgi:hypothetical protein